MNLNEQEQEQPTSQGQKVGQQHPQGDAAEQETFQPKKDEQDGLNQEIENPAAQSEIGPNIYDIGMGGPGASTSGLRTGEDSDDEDKD